MNLKTFFQIPLVKFATHLLLVIGFGLNIYHFYRVWDMDKTIASEEKQLSILKQENSDSRNQRDYYTSDLYKEKFAKEQNFKKRGEDVVDTSTLEAASDTKNGNYIPTNINRDESNLRHWWDYFFGETS